MSELIPVLPEFQRNLYILPNANPNAAGECDGCTECCTWLAIREGVPEGPYVADEIKAAKPMGVRCRWVGSGFYGRAQGCMLHANKYYPQTCRDYRCWAVIMLIQSGRPDLYKTITARLTAEGVRTVEDKF